MEMDWKARFIEAAQSLETPDLTADRLAEEAGQINNSDDLYVWSSEVEAFYEEYPDKLEALKPAMVRLAERVSRQASLGAVGFGLGMTRGAVRFLTDFGKRVGPEKRLVKAQGREL